MSPTLFYFPPPACARTRVQSQEAPSLVSIRASPHPPRHGRYAVASPRTRLAAPLSPTRAPSLVRYTCAEPPLSLRRATPTPLEGKHSLQTTVHTSPSTRALAQVHIHIVVLEVQAPSQRRCLVTIFFARSLLSASLALALRLSRRLLSPQIHAPERVGEQSNARLSSSCPFPNVLGVLPPSSAEV